MANQSETYDAGRTCISIQPKEQNLRIHGRMVSHRQSFLKQKLLKHMWSLAEKEVPKQVRRPAGKSMLATP